MACIRSTSSDDALIDFWIWCISLHCSCFSITKLQQVFRCTEEIFNATGLHQLKKMHFLQPSIVHKSQGVQPLIYNYYFQTATGAWEGFMLKLAQFIELLVHPTTGRAGIVGVIISDCSDLELSQVVRRLRLQLPKISISNIFDDEDAAVVVSHNHDVYSFEWETVICAHFFHKRLNELDPRLLKLFLNDYRAASRAVKDLIRFSFTYENDDLH